MSACLTHTLGSQKAEQRRMTFMKAAERRTVIFHTLILCVCFVLPGTAEDSPKPRNETQEKLLSHSVAGLAALNIYNTFGSLALASDLYEAKEYNAAKTQQIMDDVIKTSDMAVQMLKKFQAGSKENAKDLPVADLIECYRLLDREARLLKAAMKSRDKSAMQKFHQAHEESWAKTKEVLGIAKDTPAKSEEKRK